jgi:hypothetical protein
MKEWQKGYELDFLIEKTQKFDQYNKFSCSPFSEVKKNDIPTFLEDDSFRNLDDCVFVERKAKVRTPIKMYQDIIIGFREVGDLIIEKISLQNSKKSDKFISYVLERRDAGIWLETWAEDELTNEMISDIEISKYIGAKITTFAEIKHYWFIDPVNSIFERDHPYVHDYELHNLVKLNLSKEKILPLVEIIKSKVDKLPEFIQIIIKVNLGLQFL